MGRGIAYFSQKIHGSRVQLADDRLNYMAAPGSELVFVVCRRYRAGTEAADAGIIS
jgi:hypothetical protein